MIVSAALQTWPCALTCGDVAIAKIWDGIAVLALPNIFGFAVVCLATWWRASSCGWLAWGGSAFQWAASALASATDGSFAAASLRNSAARPKVFPMG